MENKINAIHPIALLRTSVSTFLGNTIIFYPLAVLAFIQLLVLELIYFYPRFPLSKFFGPIVRRLWSELYMHYPFNFALLPQLYYYAQIFIFIFIGSLLNAVAVEIIAAVNSNRKTTFKGAFRKTIPCYIHILLAAVISLSCVYGLSKVYGLLIVRALKIRSETGIFAILKNTIVYGAPYVDLFFGIMMTTLLAFVVPLIVLERKKIFTALWENFRLIFRSLPFVFVIVLLPTLLYVPILLLRSNLMAPMSQNMPTFQFLILLLSVLVTILIDVIVLTATTTYYLHKKENK